MKDDLWRQLNDKYRLTTAEILYHLPDYPELLQSFIWQEFDLFPEFPELKKFLDFWEGHLEGQLHSVTVTHVDLIQPAEMMFFEKSFSIH